MPQTDYRKDFPIFRHNPDLVYLDSSATSLKPQRVIDAVNRYNTRYSANIKRGIYKMSEEATAGYEEARAAVAQFIHADQREIIFTKNATEALNLVAYSLGSEMIGEGDEVVTTVMEHHSNFVPWQRLAAVNGAVFKVIDVTEDGALALDDKSIRNVITGHTKIIALTHVSNVLGTVNPVKQLVKKIKAVNPHAIIIVDGAQAVGHMPVDVGDLGCDFYAFSGHKLLGPTGIGVLWGRSELLNRMEPFLMGGDMIRTVAIEKTEFADLPEKFEAGTPPIAEAIGLGVAVNYIRSIGVDRIHAHEQEITAYAMSALKKALDSNITIHGAQDPTQRAGIIAFSLAGAHPHDIASILDQKNICVRAGHHCAMPLHTRLNIPASTRMSFHIYTTKRDIDRITQELTAIHTLFAN